MLSKVLVLSLLVTAKVYSASSEVPAAMIPIPAGSYESFVPERKSQGAPLQTPVIAVAAFDIDRTPVTNEQFLSFVKREKSWQRAQASRLFVDAGYLMHWQDPLHLGHQSLAKSPIVNVSWFAARAYCKSLGKRLPSTFEWEYIAGPDFYGTTAEEKEQYLQTILEWYSRPSTKNISAVGSVTKHRLGVQDLHGLVWEWTGDFNSIIASQESREDSSPDAAMFCGAGSLGGKDPSNYASYMRFAFRSSLKGGFSLAHLGFRCARDSASSK